MNAALLKRLVPTDAVGKTGPIGVDFGTERLNLVQITERGGSRIVNAATSLPYDNDRSAIVSAPRALKRLISTAFSQRPFRGRRIIASVPPSIVEMMVVNYRCQEGEDDEAIVRATEERLGGGDVAGRVIDYLPISRDHHGGSKAALVAVAEREAVIAFLETLRKCGLDVVALEVGPVAIQRLVRVIDQHASATTIAITFGTERSYVTVLANGELLLDRDVDFGTRPLVEKLGQALNCSEEEALSLMQRHGFAVGPTALVAGDHTNDSAIRHTLTEILRPQFSDLARDVMRIRDYAEAETRAETGGQIHAFGSLARWPGADALLSTLCGTEIVSINPFYGIDMASDAADMVDIGPICGVAVATGLALRNT